MVAGVQGKTLGAVGYTVIAIGGEILLKGVIDPNRRDIIMFVQKVQVFDSLVAQSLKVADDEDIRAGSGYPAQFLQGLINSIFGRGELAVQAMVKIINGVQELQNISGTALRSHFSVVTAIKNQAANPVIFLQ